MDVGGVMHGWWAFQIKLYRRAWLIVEDRTPAVVAKTVLPLPNRLI